MNKEFNTIINSFKAGKLHDMISLINQYGRKQFINDLEQTETLTIYRKLYLLNSYILLTINKG